MDFKLPDDTTNETTTEDGTTVPMNEDVAKWGGRDMDNLTRRELREAIRDYSTSYTLKGVETQPDMDGVPIKISKRLVRTAGKVTSKRGSETVKKVTYSWKAYQRWGWEEFTSTIRHELIHVWEVQNVGKAGHGRTFKRLARQNDTSTHCETFAPDDAKFELTCTNCDSHVAYRYRKSKTVDHPDRYRSKCCKAPLEVTDLR